MPLESLLLYTFILHQTTTLVCFRRFTALLLYTFILHQTTTGSAVFPLLLGCFIPLFYIKPQRTKLSFTFLRSCFIPLFYIKPQPYRAAQRRHRVALYLYSTSNHNGDTYHTHKLRLLYTFILHQTTTRKHHVQMKKALLYTFILHQTTTALNL